MTDAKLPPSPSSAQRTTMTFRPEELNAELATAKAAELLIAKLGEPSIVNKNFVVRYGIFSGLNNTPDNPTGYDCRMRLAVYKEVAHNSVNIMGAYFEKIWAYLMKPKYIIQGIGQQSFQQEEEGQSILGKMWGLITGKGGEKPNESTVSK